MSTSEISQVDLECSRRSAAVASGGDDEGSACFSNEGSSNSQFHSTADGDGSYDDCVDLESGKADPKKAHFGNLERDCRICHLSLVSSSPVGDSGTPIELGCCCKDDLAAAHKHCAEAWFKIKGDKVCEICNSIARNVIGPNVIEPMQQQANESAAVAATASSPSTTEARACINGHRCLNFLLACMVFAFVISWLFHFNIPS